MILNQFLVLAAVLFCIGVYGVLARRNGVAVVQNFVPSQAVVREIAEVNRPFADKSFFRLDLRKIGSGHDRPNTWQRLCLRRVDRDDPRVCVGAALDLAPQHARHRHVGAKAGAANHLVDPVRTDRTGTNDLQR